MTTRPLPFEPWFLLALLTLPGCEDRRREPLRATAPQPFPVLAPAEAPVAPPALPAAPPGITVLEARAGKLTVEGGPALDLPHGQVLLAADEETFIAQLAPALAALDDQGTRLFLRVPGGGAVLVTLLDEPAFRAWLDDGEPGKLRVIQRADGLELSTNLGKLRGPDPNGPSVPTREGRVDVDTLRAGLGLLKGRFKNARDAALVPSYGTELSRVAEALTGFFGPEGALFQTLYLVYPRRSALPDGGG